jgi:hypothetical protein
MGGDHKQTPRLHPLIQDASAPHNTMNPERKGGSATGYSRPPPNGSSNSGNMNKEGQGGRKVLDVDQPLFGGQSDRGNFLAAYSNAPSSRGGHNGRSQVGSSGANEISANMSLASMKADSRSKQGGNDKSNGSK